MINVPVFSCLRGSRLCRVTPRASAPVVTVWALPVVLVLPYSKTTAAAVVVVVVAAAATTAEATMAAAQWFTIAISCRATNNTVRVEMVFYSRNRKAKFAKCGKNDDAKYEPMDSYPFITPTKPNHRPESIYLPVKSNLYPITPRIVDVSISSRVRKPKGFCVLFLIFDYLA